MRKEYRQINAFKDWPKPDCVRKVRAFLGLLGYYLKFIKDYARTACPLIDLTRKNVKFKWNEEHQQAF